MRHLTSTTKTAVLALLTLIGLNAFPQTSALISVGHLVQKQNMFVNKSTLHLNDLPFRQTELTTASRGVLAIVVDNPETATMEKIPFRVYLVRNGKPLQNWASDTTQAVLTIEIASVLSTARPGDNLIVEPILKWNAHPRRTIYIKNLFNTNLLSLLTGKTGC